MKTKYIWTLLPCSIVIWVSGCNQESNENVGLSSEWTRTSVGSLDEQAKLQLDSSLSAKQELETTLKANLLASIQADGPHGAVNTCSTIAPQLAKSVSDQFGLRIGRTSNRLRNPSNYTPVWMESVSDQQDDESACFQKSDGTLAVSYPITIAAPCLLCHGESNNVSKEVRTVIQDLYPTDQALGYKIGDLRGWFWVEVPPIE
ncbi:MAG: DUF3365 domain-containing protein [Phycisphaerales bacterium]|nr:DUF3365 domain-containing protein [Phycisphaerales bacterium]